MENQSFEEPEISLWHISNNMTNNVAAKLINLQLSQNKDIFHNSGFDQQESRINDIFHNSGPDQQEHATMYTSSPNLIVKYTALFIEWLIFSAPFGKLLIMLLLVFIFNSLMCATILRFLFSSFLKKPVYLFNVFVFLTIMMLKMIIVNTITGKSQILAIANADILFLLITK